MKKRDIDIEILRHEITSLKHMVEEIKKDFVKKEAQEYVLSQKPSDEEQQLAALNKEISRREGELKLLIAEAKLEEETKLEGAKHALAEAEELETALSSSGPSSGTLAAKQPVSPVSMERILPPEPLPVAKEAAEAEASKETAETEAVSAEKPERVVSPVFKKLAEPKLPEIPSDDRARLQLQSPNRLFFYWSSRKNPYDNLQRLFGERLGGYDLSVRLINLKDDSVRVMPADISGTTWFDVGSDTTYRAELGFFSQNRPFIRVMYSNTVQTPRPSPSRRLASDADFAVRTQQFADVLSASGFAHENVAQDFAFADKLLADTRAREIAARLNTEKTGEKEETLAGISLLELRWVLVSLAAYAPLDELKRSVSPALVAWLESIEAQDPDALKPKNVADELQKTLGEEFVGMVQSGEVETRKRYVHKVFGGSAVEVFETFVPQLVDFPAPREKHGPRPDFPTSFGAPNSFGTIDTGN
jgi:hypothetical protein